MNFSSKKKQSMKSILATLSLALALATPAYAAIDWGFGNGGAANGSGGFNYTSSGGSLVTITPGLFGAWQDTTTVPWNSFAIGGHASQGLWDVGRSGSILISWTGGMGLTTLNIFQWVQPGGTDQNPYNGTLTFATTAGGHGTFMPVSPVTGDGWWEYTANLGPLELGDTVTVTAPAGGAVLDRLTLVPEPATLIAGAVLLVPFALSTWPVLRRRRTF
jgi:hypothetical protein